MTIATPPIVRLAERLLVDVELAVSKWPRAHRYLSGADLRRAAMRVAKRSLRAWRAKADKAERVERLADAVATLKICLQVGMRIKAFRSFGQFEALELRGITAVWRSYQGHFAHAAAHRLQQGIRRRFAWLDTATRPRSFHFSTEHRVFTFEVPA